MSAHRLKVGLLVSLVSALLAGCGAEMEESRPPPPPPPVTPPQAAQLPSPSSARGSSAALTPPPPEPGVQPQAGSAPPSPPAEPGAPPAAPPAGQAPAPTSGWVRSYPEGQWVYAVDRGWLWVPAGAGTTDVDGVPYAYLYMPAYGWTWYISPWGSGPYRYGAWVAHPWLPVGWHRGWVMRPGAGFRIGMGFRGGFRR